MRLRQETNVFKKKGSSHVKCLMYIYNITEDNDNQKITTYCSRGLFLIPFDLFKSKR